MRRVIIRLCQVIGLSVLLWGVSGCIPSFRGLKPVTRELLKPKKKPSAPAEILYLNDYYKVRWAQVGSQNRVYWRRYMRIRYNSRKSFAAATWVVAGELSNLDLRTVCPDGRVIRMDKGDVQQVVETLKYKGAFGEGGRAYKFSAPGLDEGCVVDVMWEAEVGRARPTRIAHRFPVKEAYFRYDYAPGFDLRARLVNTEFLWIKLAKQVQRAGQKKNKLTKKEKDAFVRVKHNRFHRKIEMWLNNIPAMNPRRMRMMMASQLLPPRFAKPPSLSISPIRSRGVFGRDFLVSWRNVAQGASQGRFYKMDEQQELCTDSGSLRELARKITAGASSRDAKIKALYNHLRQRITVLAPATSSPLKLRKVYAVRQGTTYDINMLFVVMLRTLGIRSHLAMIAPGNRTNYPADEPRKVFRTVATYIPAKGGAWKGLKQELREAYRAMKSRGKDYQGGRKVTGGMIVDPALRTVPLGQTPAKYAGTWALVLNGGGGLFYKVPRVNAQKNKSAMEVKAAIAANGSATGTVQVTAQGQSASKIRAIFAKTPKHMWNSKVGRYIRSICGSHVKASLTSGPNLDLKNLAGPVRFSYKFSTDSCLAHGTKHLLFHLLPAKKLRIPNLRGKKRMAAVHFGTPGTMAVNVSLTFPSGYRVWTKVPGQIAMSGPGLTGSIQTTTGTGSMQMKANMQWMRREIPATSFPKVKLFYGKLNMLARRLLLVGQRRKP